MGLTKGSNNNISEITQNLIEQYSKTFESTQTINSIANSSKILSINSSIESARLGDAGRAFSVIAKQMQNFSAASKEANERNQTNIDNLNLGINSLVGVRTADMAFDLIDKIDRNLFERNCDVQAWATFETIIDCVIYKTEELIQKSNSLLANLHQIYEVYCDIFLMDLDGTIISSAVHREHLNTNVSHAEWFQGALKAPTCHVSDMHMSNFVNQYTISYSSKIVDTYGKTIGVLSTRFNWDYIYDILNKAKISQNGKVYLIDKKGIVIASDTPSEILNLDLVKHYPMLQGILTDEAYGYIMDTDDKNILQYVFGYAHTKGYNNYAGKDWSVVIRESIQ